MSDKKYILYGAGRQGLLALQKYGKERIAYFCDGFTDRKEIDGIPVIRPEKLADIMHNGGREGEISLEIRNKTSGTASGEQSVQDKDSTESPSYTVVITPKIAKVQDEIAKSLDERGIPYLIFEKTDGKAYGTKTFRICGEGGALEYLVDEEETKGYNWRVKPTVALFRAMFERYAADFDGKRIDLTVFVGDHVLDAYAQLKENGLKHIFAYSTIYALSDKVIPIPDYRVCLDPADYSFEETPEKCREAAQKSWSDPRIAWRGTIASSDERRWLELLAQRYPEKLLVEDPAWEENKVYIPMTELTKYKYTLDIRGYGWTDRVKVLMQLGRPLFLVDRPYHEWYFDQLVPMKHYVPVREDLSDLIERYDYLEEHPDIYREIVENAERFAGEVFSPDAVMRYLRDVVMRYGVGG